MAYSLHFKADVAIRSAILGFAVVFFGSILFEKSHASERSNPKFQHSIDLPLPSSDYYPCQGIVKAFVKGYQAFTSNGRERRRNEIVKILSKFELSKTIEEQTRSDRTALWHELIRLHAIDTKSLEIFFPHPQTWKPVQIVLTAEDLLRISNSKRSKASFVMNLGEANAPITSPHFFNNYDTYFDSIYPSSLSPEQKIQILEKAELDSRVKALLSDLGAESKDQTVYGRFETHYLNVMDSRIYRFRDLNAEDAPTDSIHNPGDLRRIRDLSQKLGTRDWDEVVESILFFAKSNFKDQVGVEREAIKILDRISVLDERLKPEAIFSKDAVDEALREHEPEPEQDPAKTGAYPVISSGYTSAEDAHQAIASILIPPARGLKQKIEALRAYENFEIDAFIYLKRNSPELYEKAKRQFIKNAKLVVGTIIRYTKDSSETNRTAYRLLIKMENLADDLQDTDWRLSPRDFQNPPQ